MSQYDYVQSLEMKDKDYTFAALIMAAMRKADTNNIYMLKMAWPDIYNELERRYNAPGGMLPEESEKNE